jgi:hypothetical protein
MEPGKTSFFQALGVPTKIARGTIEITTDLKLVEAGSKVGPSEATLLNLLNISPFTYGMGISQVYDEGQTFDVSVLDISEEQLLGTLAKAVTTIATISLAINFPTVPSVFHSVVNSYKKILAVAIETEISWPEIEELKDRIANPDAYASAAPVAAAAGGDAAPAEEEKKDESEEEEDEEGFGGLLYANLLLRPLRRALNVLTVSSATKPSTATTLSLSRFLWDRLRLWERYFEQRFNRRFADQLRPTLRPNEIMIARHQEACPQVTANEQRCTRAFAKPMQKVSC